MYLVISKLCTAFRFPVSSHFPSSGLLQVRSRQWREAAQVTFLFPYLEILFFFPHWVGGLRHPQGWRGHKGRRGDTGQEILLYWQLCDLCWLPPPPASVWSPLSRTLGWDRPCGQPLSFGLWLPLSSDIWAEHGNLCWLRFLQSLQEALLGFVCKWP